MTFVRAVYLASLLSKKKIVQEKTSEKKETFSKAEDSKEVCIREEIPKQKFLMISFFRSFTTHTVFSFRLKRYMSNTTFDDFPLGKKIYIHLSKPRSFLTKLYSTSITQQSKLHSPSPHAPVSNRPTRSISPLGFNIRVTRKKRGKAELLRENNDKGKKRVKAMLHIPRTPYVSSLLLRKELL